MRATTSGIIGMGWVVSAAMSALGGPALAGADPAFARVQAFKTDALPYNECINWISSMSDDLEKDWSPIFNGPTIAKALGECSAFAGIIHQKYADIENPDWASNWEDKVGDWRRLAENRGQIAKAYVNKKIGVALKDHAKKLDDEKGNMAGSLGFSIPVGFDERAQLHAQVAQEFSPIFSAAGLNMPDDSVFAVYDAAVDSLVGAAKAQAGEWSWDGTRHDTAIEAEVAGWMKAFDPKGTVVKIGLSDAAWQVNKNSLGIPEGRYKRGQVMYKKPGLDTCIVAKFSFEQNYVGNGKYDAMAKTSGFTYLVRLQTCK